ncbi:MAG: PaaX family transcriptional regulator C-terminal domain-containing protein [Pseudomonadota bacterium]
MNVENAIDRLIEGLHETARPRVWSLIVTVLGDQVAPRGGVIQLSALQQIMGWLKIEENAVRTALSRLVKDGLVERSKEGRTSSYQLSGANKAEFDAASRKIYGWDRPSWDGYFALALFPGGTNGNGNPDARAMRKMGFGPLMQGVYLKPGPNADCTPPAQGVTLSSQPDDPDEAYDLARTAFALDDLAAQYHDLFDAFSSLDAARSEIVRSERALTARTLLIHNWRRIALRDPELPVGLLPKDWAGFKARDRVKKLYLWLLEPSETALDTLGVGIASDPEFLRARFD